MANPILLIGAAAAVAFMFSKKKKGSCRSIKMDDMTMGEFYDAFYKIAESSGDPRQSSDWARLARNIEAFDERYSRPAFDATKNELLAAALSGDASKMLDVVIESFNTRFPACKMNRSRLDQRFNEMKEGKMDIIHEKLPFNDFLFAMFVEGYTSQIAQAIQEPPTFASGLF